MNWCLLGKLGPLHKPGLNNNKKEPANYPGTFVCGNITLFVCTPLSLSLSFSCNENGKTTCKQFCSIHLTSANNYRNQHNLNFSSSSEIINWGAAGEILAVDVIDMKKWSCANLGELPEALPGRKEVLHLKILFKGQGQIYEANVITYQSVWNTHISTSAEPGSVGAIYALTFDVPCNNLEGSVKPRTSHTTSLDQNRKPHTLKFLNNSSMLWVHVPYATHTWITVCDYPGYNWVEGNCIYN